MSTVVYKWICGYIKGVCDMVIEKALTERRKFVRIHSDFPVQLKQVPQQYPVCIHNSIS